MGRPLRKDVNGVDVIGTGATTATGVRVEFFDASLRTDGVILKQRGAKNFRSYSSRKHWYNFIICYCNCSI